MRPAVANYRVSQFMLCHGPYACGLRRTETHDRHGRARKISTPTGGEGDRNDEVLMLSRHPFKMYPKRYYIFLCAVLFYQEIVNAQRQPRTAKN